MESEDEYVTNRRLWSSGPERASTGSALLPLRWPRGYVWTLLQQLLQLGVWQRGDLRGFIIAIMICSPICRLLRCQRNPKAPLFCLICIVVFA